MPKAQDHKPVKTESKRENSAPTPPPKANAQPTTGEVGGPKGPEPTRYGDWEKAGRCIDF